MKALISALTLFLYALNVSAQCMIASLSLENRITNAETIVEGTVLESTSFRAQNNQINTRHLIEVHTWYKGNETTKTLEVVTPGGLLNDTYHQVSPSLELSVKESGIFLLTSMENGIYQPYAGPQGFIRYDYNNGYANDPFNRYDATLHQTVATLSGQMPRQLTKIERPYKKVQQSKSGPITGISPELITAGTKSILTISGTGFGALRGSGKVIFPNASSGPAEISPENSQYISWKDNEIKVEVS